MKVVFLDIDGVLNCAGSESRAPSGVIGIDSSKVKRLKRVVENTNAVIVLTSTWKKEWSHAESERSPDGNYMVKKLSREGLHILDKTDDHVVNRGRGIHDWIEKHGNVDSWIAIDDDVFADYEKYGVMPHLVKTNFDTYGLTDDHVEQCISILNGVGSDTA